MKKFSLLLVLLSTLFALSACSQGNPSNISNGTLPAGKPTTSTVNKCKDGHSFTEDSDVCASCGANYFSETLDFTLSVTRDYYSVTGLGTCTRTVIHVPETHKDKPVKEIATTAFNAVVNPACEKITEIVLPSSIETIKSNAFFECIGLTRLEIQEGVTTIGGDVLRGCTALESLRIPSTITEIPSGLLHECSSVKEVEIIGDVVSIGSRAFQNCTSLESITLPETVKRIDANAFTGCTSLRNINIPVGFETIGTNVFSECEALEYNVYDGLGYLGNEENPYFLLACVRDATIKEVAIHNDTKMIAYGAFAGSSIESLTFGESIENIAFTCLNDLQSLRKIEVAAGNKKYHAAGNCLIETAAKVLVKGSKGSVIPNDGSVTTIGSYAFAYLTDLTSIEIPESIEKLNGDAFMNCEDLEFVIIHKSLQRVEFNIFSGCSKFDTIYFVGTASEWSKIDIPVKAGGGGFSIGDNSVLLAATRYYYSEERPTIDGSFWHYVDGKPTPWESADK